MLEKIRNITTTDLQYIYEILDGFGDVLSRIMRIIMLIGIIALIIYVIYLVFSSGILPDMMKMIHFDGVRHISKVIKPNSTLQM